MDMRVTDSFLTLNEEVRKCQNYESFDDCITRKYIASLLEKCKCLPFTMRLSVEVGCSSFIMKLK